MRIYLCLLSFSVLLNISCNSKHAGKTEDAEKDTYVNPLFTEALIQMRFTMMENIIIPMRPMIKYSYG